MTNGNLAYNTYSNAIFDVASYETQHGKIETIEYTEKVWLHEIKQRKTAKEQETKRIAKAEKRQKLHYQKTLGIISLVMFAACMLIGTQIDEMYTMAIPFFMGGIGLICAKNVII